MSKIFFISFIVVFPLNYIISYREFDKAYLNFFVNGTVKFAAFALVFYVLFYYTKVITKEEFKDLIEIIPILRSKNIIIQKEPRLLKLIAVNILPFLD